MPTSFTAVVLGFLKDISSDFLVIELGSGRGAFNDIHPGYVATDVSEFALQSYSRGLRVQADVCALPFRTGSVHAFFTIATLEHVARPEMALAEIDRCLSSGGLALLYPAWYVRSWAAKALNETSYRDLGIVDSVRKSTIALRNSRAWWAAKVLPGRVSREVAVRAGRQTSFRYRRLSPNLDVYATSDSDAFASMDPHAAACYYVSRGYRDLNRPSWLRRMSYQYEPVVVSKPARSSTASA